MLLYALATLNVGAVTDSAVPSSIAYGYRCAVRMSKDRFPCTETRAQDRGIRCSGAGAQPQRILRVSRVRSKHPAPQETGNERITGSDRTCKFDRGRNGAPRSLLTHQQRAVPTERDRYDGYSAIVEP